METSHNTNEDTIERVEDRLWYVNLDRYIIEEKDVWGWSEGGRCPQYWAVDEYKEVVPAEQIFKTHLEATKYLYKIARERITKIEKFLYDEIICKTPR
jgi:hypothetical protein